MLKDIKNSLNELGFNSNEINVYISLTQLGEATAALIAKKSDLPRTTVISILNKLSTQNFLTAQISKGTTYYWVESPQAIVAAFDHKIQIANQLSASLVDLYRSDSRFPHVQVFDTRQGIRKFIEKFIIELPKKSIIKTIDVPAQGNYSKIYSEQIRLLLIKEKSKKNIYTKTLVPNGSFGQATVNMNKQQSIEIKELPKGLNFSSSLWIANNMVVHFSGNPPFIAVIKHQLIQESFEALFSYFWNL